MSVVLKMDASLIYKFIYPNESKVLDINAIKAIISEYVGGQHVFFINCGGLNIHFTTKCYHEIVDVMKTVYVTDANDMIYKQNGVWRIQCDDDGSDGDGDSYMFSDEDDYEYTDNDN